MKNTLPSSAPDTPDAETIKAEVRRRYAAIATGETTLTASPSATLVAGGADPGNPAAPTAAPSGCCTPSVSSDRTASPSPASCGCASDAQARTLGYTDADLAAVPAGANLGLGCGNPVALASLRPGQTVLDLGAGAGFDAFLALRAVGPTGRVIGVDMTPEMVAKARANAKTSHRPNVEFRLGEIEALPVADATIDVILSNCVINLCPDKRPVYREAFRVLKPGGRLAVSDVVARTELSATVKNDLALHSGCLAGATPETELRAILAEAGFTDISIRPKGNTDAIITSWESKRGFESQVYAAEVTATKPGPAAACCAPTCCSE